ncbi:hypothetical protein KCP71_17890 [Salmonella enterica subsp. enterica]|nr:hypothetical protein KCP71_17890 [Salmonella enterica subsp. enterica]
MASDGENLPGDLAIQDDTAMPGKHYRAKHRDTACSCAADNAQQFYAAILILLLQHHIKAP